MPSEEEEKLKTSLLKNTLNICIGHLPFPEAFTRYVDLMLTPVPLHSGAKTIHIPDDTWGPYGDTLSEYAQLFWLLDHLDEIACDYQYLRIFHYRRFIAPTRPASAVQASNQPWARIVRADELGQCEDAFARHGGSELFNTPVHFKQGVVDQYARVHVREDMLNFARFLWHSKILPDREVAAFVAMKHFIPSSSIATYGVASFRRLFSLLRSAAGFMDSPDYQRREGYQRRAMGFLLERLNSYLVLTFMAKRLLPTAHGQNMVISDATLISATS